jgi:hypothetical protein
MHVTCVPLVKGVICVCAVCAENCSTEIHSLPNIRFTLYTAAGYIFRAVRCGNVAPPMCFKPVRVDSRG